jgi:hypothetical protein
MRKISAIALMLTVVATSFRRPRFCGRQRICRRSTGLHSGRVSLVQRIHSERRPHRRLPEGKHEQAQPGLPSCDVSQAISFGFLVVHALSIACITMD